MSDVNLLLFGCVVSFIAVGGAYVYLRECFTAEERAKDRPGRSQAPVEERLREVA